MLDNDADADGLSHAMSMQLDTSSHKTVWREMNGHRVELNPRVWRETESPTEINRILNDPSVFELISIPDQKPFDVTPILADPRFVFLRTEGGVVAFTPDDEPGSGIYEVHTNFLEDYRGEHAIQASLEAYRWMFTHTNCMMLQTRVPAFNKAAEVFCRAVGAWKWFERHEVWPTKHGNVDLTFFAMTIHDWMRKNPLPLIQSGMDFHARLEEEYARYNFVHEPHPQEYSHDLAVGACAEMIYGGEPEKGIILYNRWARVAGYGQINLISRKPLVIDIGEAKLHVTGDSFKVIECRPMA
jgi:Protein of unknown function (DUF2824)